MEGILARYRLVHFAPQKDFVFLNGKRVIRHVIPIKRGRNLRNALTVVNGAARPWGLKRLIGLEPAIPHLNVTAAEGTALVFGRVAAFVREFYADDSHG